MIPISQAYLLLTPDSSSGGRIYAEAVARLSVAIYILRTFLTCLSWVRKEPSLNINIGPLTDGLRATYMYVYMLGLLRLGISPCRF